MSKMLPVQPQGPAPESAPMGFGIVLEDVGASLIEFPGYRFPDEQELSWTLWMVMGKFFIGELDEEPENPD